MTNEEHKQLCEKIIRRDKTTSRVLMTREEAEACAAVVAARMAA